MQLNRVSGLTFSAIVNSDYYHKDLDRIKTNSIKAGMTKEKFNEVLSELKSLFDDSVEIRLYDREKRGRSMLLSGAQIRKIEIIKNHLILAQEDVWGATIADYAAVVKKFAKTLKSIK